MVHTRRGEYQSPKPPLPKSSVKNKLKNKVGSPVGRTKTAGRANTAVASQGEYSSDDFDISEEEDVNQEQEHIPSDSSFCSQASRRQRLPFNLQATLLSDIQVRGGIDKFGLESEQALALLCDDRPELYGERGDPLRRKIGKKVVRWRSSFNKSKASWLKVLSKFQVTEKPSKVQREALSKEVPIADDRKPAPIPSQHTSSSSHLPVADPSAVAGFIPSTVSFPSASSIASAASAVSKIFKMDSSNSNTSKFPIHMTSSLYFGFLVSN